MKTSLSLLMLVPALALAGEHKYAARSGTITYESSEGIAGAMTKSKVVLTWDEWGAKERKDTWSGDVLEKSNVSDDVRIYSFDYASKTAWDVAAATKGRGTELRVSWDEVSPADKKEGRARQLKPMEIAGKQCDAYEVKMPSGTLTVAGSGGVLFFHDLTTDAGKLKVRATMKATELKENVAVPPETFSPPPGWTVKKR